MREGVRYASPRAEYGWDHSLATLADCLRLAAMFNGPLEAMPVVQGLAVASQDQVRLPVRPQPDPVDPIGEYGSLEDGLKAYPLLVDDGGSTKRRRCSAGCSWPGRRASSCDTRCCRRSPITSFPTAVR